MLTEDEKRGLKTPLCRTPVSELLQFAAQFLPVSMSHVSSSQRVIDSVHQDSLFSSRQPAEGPTYSEPSGRNSSSLGYPPMPDAAEHISVVQERILWDSFSLAIDPVSPVVASAAGCEEAKSPKPSKFDESPFSMAARASDLSTPSTSKVDVKSDRRSQMKNTPRRSRVVARFGVGVVSSENESPHT